MYVYNKIEKTGSGLINKFIDKLPIELHLPSYNFCGPGTKLNKRIERGDEGINPLDSFCKEHDFFYLQNKDIKSRNIADNLLANQAWSRVKSSDSTLGEKLSALIVAGIMKGKSKLGMGLLKNKKVKRKKIGKGVTKRPIFKKPKKRIIKIPKYGGFLPLLFPILGALGALAGGASGIAKAVIDSKDSKKKLLEEERHNKVMEELAKQVKGSGISLKKLRMGRGLYLKPYSKNFQ